MKRLPSLGQSFCTLFLLLVPVISFAQPTDEDLQKMGRNAQGFQFHLKFKGAGSVTPFDAKYNKITALLDKYKGQVPADIQSPFRVQGPAAAERPFLTESQQSSLKNVSAQFFREMSAQGLTVQDLQRYKEVFKNKNPMPGDNPVDPKIAWKGEFEGIERTLMGGRTLMIMDVWKQTMVEYFNAHPEAVGVVYGQMDIGSWVKMNVDGLGFAADIDFGTIATDAVANKAIHDFFADNLKRASGLGMIPIDVVHTAHGLAGAEVFIGEWGKAFAEVDMLRRGRWKLLEMVRNENGQIVDVRTVEKPGKDLFMEKGVEQEQKAQQKDPANQFDPREKYPELRIDMEPMLSLEMLRHAMHDIEHGPFEGGQKIIKMIKYTERSFFMINEALKNVSPQDQATYFSLSQEEQQLKTLCEEVIKNKGNASRIATLLEAFTGKKLENNEQVNLIVEDMVAKCKKAMLKNANQAFGFRVKQIAQIQDDGQRFDEADRFLKQLEQEYKEGYEAGKTEFPATMRKAMSILADLRAGKIAADQVDKKIEELNKLMEEEYKVDKSFIERLVGDPFGPVRKYLIERGYGPEAVQKMIAKFKDKFVENWKQYAPELAQRTSITAYEYANHVRNKLNAFNEHLAKTKTGRVLSSEMLNQIDNTIALYDAWMSGKDLKQSAWRVSWTAGTIWAQGKWPFLAIPLGIYNSIETKSVAPAAMAVAFYLFPMAGQAYMITNIIDRLVVSNVRDYTFRNHLDRLSVMAKTNGEGHVILFRVPKAFNGLTGSGDSLETEPDIPVEEPGRTAAVKRIFYDESFLYCPDIKYFNSLIPRKEDQFGMYDYKMKNLMSLFAFDNEFVGYLIGVDKFKKDKEEKLLENDGFAEDRAKMLDSLETGIEDHLWMAIFTAIESTKRAEKKGVIDELEAVIVRLQDSLFLDEYRMKKIDSLSLLLKIRRDVQNDPLYKQALKDKFSAGTAYERVAIPTLERYIQVYRQIIVIQDKIFEIWHPFGVNTSAIQEDPFRLLLQGGLSGAPMLTTDADKDMQVAIQCLEAHTKRASDIRMDLANALGRPIKEDDPADKEHLRIIGEYGFGFEHLVDADVNGRSPLFKDENGVVVKKMQEYGKAYRDYLDRIKQGPTVKLKLKLTAERKTMETVPLTATVAVVDEKGNAAKLPPDVKIIWNKVEGGQEVKAGEGNTLTENAEKKGYVSYIIHLQQTRNNKTTELDKTYWDISVEEYNLSDPSKGVIIKLPAVIKQYDIFDVSAEIPAAMKGRTMKCSWGYDVMGARDDCSKATMQIVSEQNRRGEDGKDFLLDSITIGLTVEMPEPGKYSIPKYINRKVKFQHMALSAKVSDIWEGGSGPTWVSIKRKEIKSPQRVPPWSEDKKPVSTASAYAQLNVKKEGPFAATVKSMDELKAYMEKEYNIPADKKRVMKAFSLGDFKGYGVYTAGSYAPGGWSFDGGYRAAGASAGFEGFVMKGKAFLKVTWWAGASGAFDNSDKGWMMAQINTLDKECQGIVAGMSLQPDGRLTKSPYTGPKLDGSDYPMVVIEPKVDTIQPGSKITVKAVVKNDKTEYGPYTYAWTGHVEGNDKNVSAQLVSDRPGKKSITVSVDGNTPPGSATLEYVVAPLKVKLVKLSPATNKIIVGMPVELRADFAGAVPAGKKLQYLWQPHPEEKFDPFEGEKNTTKLVFAKPGHKKIWVQVLDKTTAETITMGESDQLELDVEKPGFTITFTPAKAPVSQPVVAKITSTPDKLEEVSYRWLPLPANANLIRESQDGSEITFYAEDALQIPVEMLAVVKGSGEELGKAKAYFSAERYQVKAEGPKVQGPKPMIWVPGQGLVEVDKEIAVHQVVEFTAVVTPQPSSSLTYGWKVTQGNASISNPASRDARVTALETGSVQLTITVKDNNGVELGTGTAVFNATISSEMISNGAKQKKDFDNKMQQARQLIRDGKLDEAFTLAGELKGMNAKEAAPLLTELGTACKKSGKDAAYERDFPQAVKRYEQALQLNPNDAEAKKQLDQVKKWQKEWPNVLAKGREMETVIAQKNLPAAFKCLTDLNNLQFNMPGQMANKWSQEKQLQYYQLTKRFDSVYTIAQSNWKAQFLDKDFETALTDWEGFKKEWTAFPATAKEVDGSIQLCKSQIAEKKKIYDDFVQTKNKLEQGLPTDPKLTPAAFEYQAVNRFSVKDPRRQEMIDFARGWDKRQKDIQANKALAAQKKSEGQQAEAKGDKATAIGKYRESVALVPDADLSAKIKKMETDLADEQAIRGKADELWNEGEKLAKKKKTRAEGLSKMKESLKYWNSPERISQARETEKDENGSYSSVNMTGTWKHGNTETFTFASSAEAIYSATEKGFDNATGTLSMIGQMGILSYTTRNNLTGQYILTIVSDGNSGTGQWTDSRKASGQRNFTRISKPPEKEPDVADNNDKDKKKKGIGGFLDKINKGLDKIDSVISGKKPDDKGVDPADVNKEEKIFDNGNTGGVSSGPTSATTFTLSKAVTISRIENYHYFNRGTAPGTIGLKSSTGKTYGPWKAYGLTGQGGVQNAYWNVLPEISLPAGTYTVIDSDPSTWSHNGQSKGCGFTRVWIRKTPPPPVDNDPDKGVNPADPTKEQKIFDNGNIGGVSSGPPSATVFTFSSAVVVTRIENYHYFNNGKKPGTIGLRSKNGTLYGPWQAHGLIGQGGVQNAYWAVLPNLQLPAGTYTVIDSDPSTWSYNSESKGCGFTTIWTTKSAQKPVVVQPGHKIENVETGGGVTAEKIFITGDIDNLGFKFPAGFDVFSGNSTPSHGYPWKVDPNDAKGTDRIMVGSGARGNADGYSSTTNRADTKPEAITLYCDVSGLQLESAVLQLFLDDFQAPSFGSKFTVTINGKRAAFLESVINSLSQTGPIGKLVSVKIPPEFFSDIRSGKLVILIDDATSGVGDGYAVDFVRLVINPSAYSYTGTITGVIYRPDGQPAAGASVSAGGIISGTANSKGEFTLKNVPAGMVNVQASYNNHHHTRINADLAAGKTIKITINLPAD